MLLLSLVLLKRFLAAKSGAAYISPFVGRVDDNGFDGIDLITNISVFIQRADGKNTSSFSIYS